MNTVHTFHIIFCMYHSKSSRERGTTPRRTWSSLSAPLSDTPADSSAAVLCSLCLHHPVTESIERTISKNCVPQGEKPHLGSFHATLFRWGFGHWHLGSLLLLGWCWLPSHLLRRHNRAVLRQIWDNATSALHLPCLNWALCGPMALHMSWGSARGRGALPLGEWLLCSPEPVATRRGLSGSLRLGCATIST